MQRNHYIKHDLTETEFNKIKQLAIQCAIESGKLINHYYTKPLIIETKQDKSPVTIADQQAEKIIRQLIEQTYPEHNIIGEEEGEKLGKSKYTWMIDPIDGTKSFIYGGLDFGTIIALLEDGKPILGVVHHPILNQLTIGDGYTTLYNDKPVSMKPCSNLAESILLTTDLKKIDTYQNLDDFNQLVSKVKLMRTWGNCYGYTLLARGIADIMIDPNTSPWDSMALIPIICGAGGIITDYQGQDPISGNSIVACSPELHAAVIQLINASTPKKNAPNTQQAKNNAQITSQINQKTFTNLTLYQLQQLITVIGHENTQAISQTNYILHLTAEMGELVEAIKLSSDDLSIDFNPNNQIVDKLGEIIFVLFSLMSAHDLNLEERLIHYAVNLPQNDQVETLTAAFYNHMSKGIGNKTFTLPLLQEYINNIMKGNGCLSILINQIKDELVIHIGKLAKIAQQLNCPTADCTNQTTHYIGQLICDCLITICFFADLYRIDLANILPNSFEKLMARIHATKKSKASEINPAI